MATLLFSLDEWLTSVQNTPKYLEYFAPCAYRANQPEN